MLTVNELGYEVALETTPWTIKIANLFFSVTSSKINGF